MNDIGGAPGASPCLALDIGASKVDVAVVDRDGVILSRGRVHVTSHSCDLFDAIVHESRGVLKGCEVSAVGVGCAGPMTRGGETVSPLNIVGWRDFPLRRSLHDALDLDIFIEGDARALALAEGAFGAARDQTSYVS